MKLLRCTTLFGLLLIYFVPWATGRKTVICYVSSKAIGRPDQGRFSVLDADTLHCTHVVYAFLGVLKETGEIVSIDPYTSIEKLTNRKNQLADLRKLKLKNPNVKLLVSIGGWNEKGDKFSEIARSPDKRSIFIRRVTELLSDFELDGVDICWQFPGLRGGKPEDKQNSIIFFQELKDILKPYGWLLTAHIVGKKYVIDKYNIKAVSEIVDFINFPTLEYHGHWERKTGIMAPLVSKTEHNVKFAVDYVLKKGVPSSKLILGLPMYGCTFLLQEPPRRNHYIGLFSNETFSSPWTNQGGIIAYNELCFSMNKTKGWKEVWDEESQTPIAYNDRKLVSFDNKRSLIAKATLVNTRDLGGVMIWYLDMDDFLGLCHGVKFPLLTAVSYFINNGSISELEDEKPRLKSESNPSKLSDEHGKKMLCYIVGTTIHRPGLGKYSIEHVDKNHCTHIVYAFLTINETTSKIASIDAATDKLWIPKFKNFKKEHPHITLLVSVGGFNQGSKRFSDVALSAQKRKIFISSVLQFLQANKLDGIDISWQFPGLRDGRPEDKINSLRLLKELKVAIKPKGYLLTLHLYGLPVIIESYNISAAAEIVDYINFAAFDYNGPTKETIAVTSPLVSTDGLNVLHNLDYILKKGVPPSKLLLGLPLFGHSYILVDEPRGQYIGLAYDHIEPSPWTDQLGFISFIEVCYETTGNEEWIQEWDEYSQTPIAYNGRRLISYDNEKSLLLKAKLVETKGLAGVMIWTIDMDDYHGLCYDGKKYPAVSAISRYLSSIQYSKPELRIGFKQTEREVISSSSEKNKSALVVSFEYGSA